MVLIQCYSQEIINGIYRSGGCFEAIEDDYTGPREDFSVKMMGMIHLLPIVDNNILGCISFMVKSAIMVEAHIAILKEYQAQHAFRASKQAIEWIWRNTQVKKIMGMTPDTLPHIKRFILKLGFEQEGINKSSFMKDGVLYDQYYAGLQRQEK